MKIAGHLKIWSKNVLTEKNSQGKDRNGIELSETQEFYFIKYRKLAGPQNLNKVLTYEQQINPYYYSK
jgi:hypothetical protein